jgi:hypothetical protein
MRNHPLTKALLTVMVLSMLIFLSLPGAFAAEFPGGLSAGTSKLEPVSERFGVVSSHLMLSTPQVIGRQLDAIVEAGIKWVRCTFTWPDLERRQGTWDFSRSDFLVEEAQERGVHILAILGASPPWANGGKNYRYPPTDMAAWSNYVSTVCSRYAGRITAWEIWNEQNIRSFWQPTPDPRQYVQVLRYASEAIRRVSPGAKVIMGGVAGLGQTYLNDCFAAGAADNIDAIAYHPYFSEMRGYWNPFEIKPNEARFR